MLPKCVSYDYHNVVHVSFTVFDRDIKSLVMMVRMFLQPAGNHA